MLVSDFNVAWLSGDVRSNNNLLRAVTHTGNEVFNFEQLRRAGNWTDVFDLKSLNNRPTPAWWNCHNENWETVNKYPRLNYIWISENLVKALKATEFLEEALRWDPPSDHAPIIITLDIGSRLRK